MDSESPLCSEIALSPLAHKNLKDIHLELAAKLSTEDQRLALELFYLLDRASNGERSPRIFQLEAAISIIRGNDTIVRAGTGSGKTLVMILVLLYCKNEAAVTIVPLKLLQTTFVDEFGKYGIRAIAINADTPLDPDVFQDILGGKYQNFFIAPEQCTKNDRGIKTSQAPRFSFLLNIPAFRGRIRKVFIDEVHFCVTAGLSRGGTEGAFRPAYACLDGFRVRLPVGVPFGLFSATLPLRIKEKLNDLLLLKPNTTIFELPTYRPNFTYAVIPMDGSLSTFKNLDFLVPPVPLDRLPFHKFLVWIENSKATEKIARYLTKRLPEDARDSKPFVHIHSGMSHEYKQKALLELCKVDGSKRGVIATGSMSNGINILDFDLIVFYGTAELMVDFEQKSGRGGRDGRQCLILTIAEDWLYQTRPTKDERDKADPKATGTAAKRLRTADEMFDYTMLSSCRPKFIADSNDDNSRECTFSYVFYTLLTCLLALNPLGICCDGHDDFNLNAALKLAPHVLPPIPDKPKKKRNAYRKTEDRGELEDLLKTWRKNAWTSSPTAKRWDEQLILTDEDLIKLAMAKIGRIQQASDVVELLEESPSWALYWADRILRVILNYNANAGRFLRRKYARKRAAREAAGELPYESEEDDSDSDNCSYDGSDSENDLENSTIEPPWVQDLDDTPVPMDIDIPASRPEESVFKVDAMITAKESIIAGNSYSIQAHRQSQRKHPRTENQNQPLFTREPLLLKKEQISSQSTINPLRDKTNAGSSSATLSGNSITTQDVIMAFVRILYPNIRLYTDYMRIDS
ncbi:P-loop containing nucleoside triphosphate hydrolase protein [Schizopora paradoxa]|uniref:DNA 3'-5' helicase n=1 Tax=Schizopora paradoxa TaxID=27342 RepID=A0A0H2R4B3_9AGAM|nr:P-loop containing nucleoside triphosphate hydrolase protein [Schizopora paradoxa]